MKKVLLLCMSMLLGAMLVAGCGSEEKETSSATGGSDKPIVIGLDDSYPPMGFKDENNEIVGFDVDLAKEATKRLNRPVEFKAIDWSSKEAELKSGRVDILWNGLDITEKRKENMLFSDPYMKNRQVIFVPVNSDIKSLDQLKGKVIGTQSGSTAEDFLDNNQDYAAQFAEVKKYGDFYVVNVKISLDNCDRISASKGSVYGHLFISGFNKAYKGSIYVDDVTLTVDKKSVVKQNYENGKNSGCWYYLNRSEKEYTPAVVSFSGKTLDVTKTSLTIKKGKKATIKATAMPKTKITYQSKNKKVATVNSKGVVRGIRKGKTTILVTANGKTVKVQITVK